MGQPDGIGSQFLDDPGIRIMILSAQRIALVQLILMSAHAPQGSLRAVDDKALLGIAGEAPDTHSGADLIIRLVPALEGSRHRVQIGVIDIPSGHIGYIDGDFRLVRRPHGRSHFPAPGIFYGIQHRKVLVPACHPGYHLKGGSAALAGHGSHL